MVIEHDICISNLSVSFPVSSGLVNALKETNLVIKHNHITGLIGESGCGKSVLGLSIMRLLPGNAQTDGCVTIAGSDIFQFTAEQLRYWRAQTFGIIPQNPEAAFNPIRKIRKQVTEALWNLNLCEAEIVKKLKILFDDLGLVDFKRIWNAYPFQLSGGMQQKILCALTLAGHQSWIIADEPNKGLDYSSLSSLKENLLFIKNKNNRGMLVITHDIDLANEICDKIVVMYAGEIVETGSTVISKPLHPYTKAFINAMPQRGFQHIPGNSPNPLKPVVGCSFAPRCSQSMPRCFLEKPGLYKVESSNVRCFLYD